MARRKKSKQDTLIDELLQDCHNPKDILGQNGLLKQLSKRLIERALQGELTDHLGYAPLLGMHLRNHDFAGAVRRFFSGILIG
jgi:hypothetical protein